MSHIFHTTKKMNLPRTYFNNMEIKWESLLYQIKTYILLDLVNVKTKRPQKDLIRY